MRTIDGELVARWHASLVGLVQLDLGEGTGSAIRAFDDTATSRERRGLCLRGPLGAFRRYHAATCELEQVLSREDPADPDVARARSAAVHADFEAAGLALDLALIAAAHRRAERAEARVLARPSSHGGVCVDPAPGAGGWLPDHESWDDESWDDEVAPDGPDTDVLVRLLHGATARTRLDEVQITELARALTRTRTRGRVARHDPPSIEDWEVQLLCDLHAVTDDATAQLLALHASALGGQAADGIGASLSTLLDDDVLGKLIEASAHATTFLQRVALELAHAGLRKVAGFCDDDVRKSLGQWFARDAGEHPELTVASTAGVEVALEAWTLWSSCGVDVGGQLGAVGRSRDEHLQHLVWAHRAAGVAALAYASALATPPTVPFAVFFGGVALVGIAGWMLWAAGDHCRTVTDLA